LAYRRPFLREASLSSCKIKKRTPKRLCQAVELSELVGAHWFHPPTHTFID
jgi:hypothetical protein